MRYKPYTFTRILRHIVTSNDHEHVDVIHVLLLFGVLAYIIFTGYSLYFTRIFNAMDFGTGLATILVGGGGGSFAKNYLSVNGTAVTTTATATTTATTVDPIER